jgi:hypothetical protein
VGSIGLALAALRNVGVSNDYVPRDHGSITTNRPRASRATLSNTWRSSSDVD